jgi:hypothetical protein
MELARKKLPHACCVSGMVGKKESRHHNYCVSIFTCYSCSAVQNVSWKLLELDSCFHVNVQTLPLDF